MRVRGVIVDHRLDCHLRSPRLPGSASTMWREHGRLIHAHVVARLRALAVSAECGSSLALPSPTEIGKIVRTVGRITRGAPTAHSDEKRRTRRACAPCRRMTDACGHEAEHPKNFIWLALSQIATWSGSLVLVVVAAPSPVGGGVRRVPVRRGFRRLLHPCRHAWHEHVPRKAIARDDSSVGPYILNAIGDEAGALTVLSAVAAIMLAHLLAYPERDHRPRRGRVRRDDHQRS